jgi:hypothetical protein
MATWKVPEDVLWTLHKADRTAEARTGTGGDQPELRIYAGSGKQQTYDLLFSQVMKDTRAVRAMAAEKKREFEAQGWSADK